MPAAFATLPLGQRLDLIREKGLWQLVQDHLGGDWARCAELLDGIHAGDFAAWVERQPFPSNQIHDTPRSLDGVYLLPDAGGWCVFDQERGQRIIGSETRFATFEDAKCHAYAMVCLGDIRLQP